MKIKLLKCLICNHWRLPRLGDHCPVCNSAQIHIGSRMSHIDVTTNREVVSGIHTYNRMNDHKLAIARILSD